MRVALYYPWIYLTSGVERTLLELSVRSRHHWTLYTSFFKPEHTYPGLSQCKVVTVGSVSVARDIRNVGKSALEILRLRLPMEDHDMLVVASEGLGDFVVFRNAQRPVLCLCFTPLRAIFDTEYRERARQERGTFGRLALDAGSWLFRNLDRLAWKRYARVICISNESRKRALAGGLTDEGKIELLHPAPAFGSVAALSERFDRYFLLPGRIMWTKNLELGIAAFRKFKAEHPEFHDFRLIVSGIVDKKSEPYFAKVRDLASADASIEFRVLPSDEELAELYRNCFGVLFTAFNEDWGLVPLEAMSFGKPVIAVDRGGPRETIETGVQGFLEEPTAAAFAARMSQLASDPALARQLGRAGIERSKKYSWDAFTDHIDAEVDRLCGADRGVDRIAKINRVVKQEGLAERL
jgi:glycosyltransferase involved in cell wall biosynthesis